MTYLMSRQIDSDTPSRRVLGTCQGISCSLIVTQMHREKKYPNSSCQLEGESESDYGTDRPLVLESKPPEMPYASSSP